MHLVAHEPGPCARKAVEQPVPASRGENDHVVGRWQWSSRARRAHRPEKLLWRREVDHAVDPQSHGPQRTPLDADRVANGHTEVGGSLLGEQDALASPDELPELVGVGAPVVRRNAEHEAGAGSPVDTMRPGGEPADARVVDEQCRAHAREMRDRAPDMGRARARLRLDLPIQRHARQRPLRHGRGRSREERSDCRDQRNRDGDARGRRENARPPVQDQAGEPARNHQAALRSLRRRPSEMLQHCSSRAAISASCVRDHERGSCGIGGIQEHVDHMRSRGRVELTGRLVGEHQAGSGRQGARNGDALRLSAGQLLRQLGGERVDVEEAERLVRARPRVLLVRALEQER